MSLSIRDQLLNIGLIKPGEASKKLQEKPNDVKHREINHRDIKHRDIKHRHGNKPAPTGSVITELTLEQAYQARVALEKAQLAQKKREAEQKLIDKRERKQKALALITANSKNVADATELRYFTYAKKIRSIYATAEQRALINSGALGIAQMDGRFHLLDADIARQIQQFAPEFIALYGQSSEPASKPATEYLDDKFQVPDDLVW